MSTSIELFKARCPEFAALSDDEITGLLEDAAASSNPAAFGSRYQVAMIFKAAHEAKLNKDVLDSADEGASTSGPAKARKTGDNAESYADLVSSSGSDSARYYMTTAYGRRYWSIVRTRPAARAGFIS